MERPFVACHVLSSAAGMLEGDFWLSPVVLDTSREYARIRNEYAFDAAIYGSVTMGQTYTQKFIRLSSCLPAEEREDHIVQKDYGRFFVSLDPEGTVGYSGGFIEKRGNPRAHVISVATGKTPAVYLEYLRTNGVSYVFAGEDAIDLGLLLRKLKEIFGIEKVLVAGGGRTDSAFLKEGLIDEISIVVAPALEPGTDRIGIFAHMDDQERGLPVSLELKNIARTDEGTVILKYIPLNRG